MAATAFTLWGVYPFYFKALEHVPPLEIVAHRIFWSTLMLAPLIQLQAKVFAEIVTGRRALSAFDDFVATWRARGGAQLEQAANELFARRSAILAAAGAEVPP